MAIRAYLVPWAVRGVVTQEWYPKYTDIILDPEKTRYSGIRYGVMDDGLLFVEEPSTEQHQALVGNADVDAFPPNLGATLGANRNTVEAELEQRGIPANWVLAAMTYKQVLRITLGICLLAQRFDAGEGQRLVPQGVTLNTTAAEMPLWYIQRLVAAIDSLKYDRSMLDSNSTLRDLLYAIGQQQAPITILGEEL